MHVSHRGGVGWSALLTLLVEQKRLAIAGNIHGQRPVQRGTRVPVGPAIAGRKKIRTAFADAREWFSAVRPEIEEQCGLTLVWRQRRCLAALQGQYPEQFADGQLRTLQRRIRQWRATEGPAQEVHFVQDHRTGELCELDVPRVTDLRIMIVTNRSLTCFSTSCPLIRTGRRDRSVHRRASPD